MYYNDNEKYEFGPLRDNYRVFLEFMNKIYSDGILHPAWATMSEDDESAYWGAGKYGVWTGPAAGSFESTAPDHPYGDAKDYTVLPLEVNGKRASIRNSGRLRVEWGINAMSKNKEKAIEVTDYFYSEKGAETITFGREGYAWVKDDNSPWKRRWILNCLGYYPLDDSGNMPKGDAEKTRKQGICAGLQRIFPSDAMDLDEMAIYLNPSLDNKFPVIERYNKYKANGLFKEDAAPMLQFTSEESREISDINSALNTYIDEESVKFINGQRSFSTYDDFIKQIKVYKAERLQELYNAALGRLVK
jgi:putative aldouronate transport system substrate-binding protein